MVEYDKVYDEKVKFSGIFDFKELYRIAYNWLTDSEFWIEERKYAEKINPNGKEITIMWYARRKISDYFRFQFKIEWTILRMTSVEITDEDGNKLRMNKGDLELKITAIIEKDYENRWEANAFFKFIRGSYDRFVVRNRIEKYEDKIVEELIDYVATLKSFLNIEARRLGS